MSIPSEGSHEKSSIFKRLSPSFGRKHHPRPKSTPFELGQSAGDDTQVPQIVLTSQSDASNHSNTPRNLSGVSTPRNPSDVNSNLLSSAFQQDDRRARSNSALSLVEQALAEEGLPQDSSLAATVHNELGDSLNFSKDQLEGAARDIILDFEREAGTTLQSPSDVSRPLYQGEAGIESQISYEGNQNYEDRPDRTSYI